MTLTPVQLQAAHTIDCSVGIVANAGSGKTRVLVERVCRILETTSVGLSQILLVTFTDKAAQELKNRLAKRLSERRLELMTAPITTFHGFATRVLREHAPTLGLPATFQIASEGEAAALLHQAVSETILGLLDAQDPHATLLCQRFKFRTLLARLIPLLEDRWSFQHYMDSTAPSSEVIAAIRQVFTACEARYRRLKRDGDLLDFHDLEIFTWQLLRDSPQILSDYQRQFAHILVDEFQDTNPLQAAIIRQLFTPPDNILCIVGDPKQSIYRFRRADVSCFADMLQHIAEAGGTTIVLPDNFRSAPAIIDFVNTACSDMPQYTPLVARCRAPDFPAVCKISIPPMNGGEKISAEDRRRSEARAIVPFLPELAERHGGYGQIACLFQTRDTLQIWANGLRVAGFPVHIYSSGGFWNRPEIRALIFPLHVLVGLQLGRPDERFLLAMLLSPLFSVTLDEVYRWIHLMPAGPESSLPRLHRAVFQHSPVGNLLQQWREAARTHTLHELLRRVIDDTHLMDRLSAQDPSGQAASNVEAFLRRLQVMGRTRARELAVVLDQLTALQEMRDRTPDAPATIVHDNAIQMMTIHAAKGNEFPAVILPGLFRQPRSDCPSWLFEPGLGFALKYEDEFATEPIETPEWLDLQAHYARDEKEERTRLLYVALTRAAQELILPVHPDLLGTKKRMSWHDQLAVTI